MWRGPGPKAVIGRSSSSSQRKGITRTWRKRTRPAVHRANTVSCRPASPVASWTERDPRRRARGRNPPDVGRSAGRGWWRFACRRGGCCRARAVAVESGCPRSHRMHSAAGRSSVHARCKRATSVRQCHAGLQRTKAGSARRGGRAHCQSSSRVMISRCDFLNAISAAVWLNSSSAYATR